MHYLELQNLFAQAWENTYKHNLRFGQALWNLLTEDQQKTLTQAGIDFYEYPNERADDICWCCYLVFNDPTL